MSLSSDKNNTLEAWPSAVPPKRWWGYRHDKPGLQAFQSHEAFKIAQQSELLASLTDHERATLGRLLARGQKLEIEVFLRTHGANPVFDPHAEIEIPLGIAKAEPCDISSPPSREALNSILDGRIVHVLFQAGEASRFQKGPFYTLNPTAIARQESATLKSQLDQIDQFKTNVNNPLFDFIVNGSLGPKQSILIRAALRRAVEWEIQLGYLPRTQASQRYQQALQSQLILYFVNRRSGLTQAHDETLRKKFQFYGFDPTRIVTVEQDLVPSIRLDEAGNIFLREEEWAHDAAGHLYALIQASRSGDFTAYTKTGEPAPRQDIDALGYLMERGGQILNIIRINDMDRHTTEIINPRALSFALSQFNKGVVNVIEAVANPTGQKGGTGITLGNPRRHVLTETHENTFPAFSRAFESALKTYLDQNKGQHPAYNAMRQWADLSSTRKTLQKYAGRIVFVPRKKDSEGQSEWSIGVDMPMGDLSLLGEAYSSRMFQFVDPVGRELAIHDMKQVEQLPFYMEVLLRQLSDPFILSAFQEIQNGKNLDFDAIHPISSAYGAPAPELSLS